MRCRAGASVLVALMIMVVASISLPTAAAAAQSKPKHKHKPDLVVQGLVFRSSPSQSASANNPSVIIEKDGTGKFGIEFKIKNIGRGPAHTSRAQVLVNDERFHAPVRVGPIASGKAKSVTHDYHTTSPGMSTFTLSVCADSSDAIKESKESNNCSQKITFATIPRTWDAIKFTAGFHSDSSGDGEARSSGMSFDFYGTVNENGTPYFFWLARGGVTETLSGTDTGNCVISGEGKLSHDPWGDQIDPDTGYLEIPTDLSSYFAKVEEPDTEPIHGHAACPNPVLSTDFDQAIIALETIPPPESFVNPIPSSSELSGTYSFAGGGQDVHGSWDLQPEL